MLLVLLWIVALLLWSFTRLAATFRFAEAVSSVIFLVLLWPWIRGPYLLYTRGSLPLCANFVVQHSDAEVFEFPHNYISSLDKLGFEFAGLLAQDSAQIRPKLRIAMYVHPVNRDSAQAARMESRRGIIYVLVFKTRFNDGFAFETSNNFTARIFPQNQEFPVFRFPMMRSELDLYRIHQALKERFSATRSPIVGGGVEELNEFVAQAEAAHRRNASLDYKLSEAGDRYVFTLRGAIRCAWLLTWPVKPTRQMRAERKAMAIAEELGLPIHPKFGCLEDSFRERVRLRTKHDS